MALPKRNLRLGLLSVFWLLFAGSGVLQNSDKLLSISGVRGVHVLGLAASAACCGVALVGVIRNLVVRWDARDKVEADV